MLEDRVLITIYRSLRDSISKNIKDVYFDKKKGVISLSYMDDNSEYPYSQPSNAKMILCEINKNGIYIPDKETDKPSSPSWLRGFLDCFR